MGVSYKPSLKEYCSILKDYAISGIASYDSLDSATRLRVERSRSQDREPRQPPICKLCQQCFKIVVGRENRIHAV